jgi:hypothetical protein
MARHVLRIALMLLLLVQHVNRQCNRVEAIKFTGNPRWPTLRNVDIHYRIDPVRVRGNAQHAPHGASHKLILMKTRDILGLISVLAPSLASFVLRVCLFILTLLVEWWYKLC